MTGSRLSESPARRLRRAAVRAFTLVELLVVVAIIALLLGILLPAMQKARDVAVSARCMSNLKTIGTGIYFYAQDSNDYLMPFLAYMGTGITPSPTTVWNDNSNWWVRRIPAYLNTSSGVGANPGTMNTVLRCPSMKGTVFISYGLNFYTGRTDHAPNYPDPIKLARVLSPSIKILSGDTNSTNATNNNPGLLRPYATWVYNGNPEMLSATRHINATNYVFVDGHVETSNDYNEALFIPGDTSQQDQYWSYTK